MDSIAVTDANGTAVTSLAFASTVVDRSLSATLQVLNNGNAPTGAIGLSIENLPYAAECGELPIPSR